MKKGLYENEARRSTFSFLNISNNKNLPKLIVELPPVGKYCNGCYDGPPGGNPFVEENEVINGEWVTGGHDTPTTDRKWNYIYYIFQGVFQGKYIKNAIELPINESGEYGKSETKYSYKKIGEVINKNGLKVYAFQVTPTFDSDSIGRKDAIFSKDGNTYYIMFDWKDKSFDDTFDQIINSVKL